jgi:signal transduction histidine kinase
MSNSAIWELIPEINSRESAIQVTYQGVLAAVFSCVITVILAVLSLFGFNPWCLVDAIIFAVVAWRIYRLSFSWSVIGLVLFIIEKVYQLFSSTIVHPNIFGWIIAAVCVMCYVNSIRATWFLRKNNEPKVDSPGQSSISN